MFLSNTHCLALPSKDNGYQRCLCLLISHGQPEILQIVKIDFPPNKLLSSSSKTSLGQKQIYSEMCPKKRCGVVCMVSKRVGIKSRTENLLLGLETLLPLFSFLYLSVLFLKSNSRSFFANLTHMQKLLSRYVYFLLQPLRL